MENSRVFKQKKNSDSAWHNNSPQEVLVAFKSDCSGLSQAEAERRLKLHGPNRLEPPKQQGPFIRFLMQFHNVLIYVESSNTECLLKTMIKASRQHIELPWGF